MPVESNSANRSTLPPEFALDDTRQVCLCEVLDRVLNKGVVLAGEATISVSDIGLIYLGLQVVLTSMVTAHLGLRPAPSELSSKMTPTEPGMRME